MQGASLARRWSEGARLQSVAGRDGRGPPRKLRRSAPDAWKVRLAGAGAGAAGGGVSSKGVACAGLLGWATPARGGGGGAATTGGKVGAAAGVGASQEDPAARPVLQSEAAAVDAGTDGPVAPHEPPAKASREVWGTRANGSKSPAGAGAGAGAAKVGVGEPLRGAVGGRVPALGGDDTAGAAGVAAGAAAGAAEEPRRTPAAAAPSPVSRSCSIVTVLDKEATRECASL
jgi:hypothetical protein